jgi:hypothetical protein
MRGSRRGRAKSLPVQPVKEGLGRGSRGGLGWPLVDEWVGRRFAGVIGMRDGLGGGSRGGVWAGWLDVWVGVFM